MAGILKSHTGTADRTIVFDIGGTWFRSAILGPDGKLGDTTKIPAINFKNSPLLSVQRLQESLVDYIITETGRLRDLMPDETIGLVSIAVGAAVNAHTGLILNSGPLWGPDSVPFDLLDALKGRDAGIEWIIVNDVTAALAYYARSYRHQGVSKLTLLTVSTGIGCRTYDARKNSIPVDRAQGLQGEIGHLPISFLLKGAPLELACDCGGLNHLNAFCSGRGIESVIRSYAAAYPQDLEATSLVGDLRNTSGQDRLQPLVAAVDAKSQFADDVLDAVTLPVAQMILALFTIDPEVELVILTGGVVNIFRDEYLARVLRHLERVGLYQTSQYNPAFFQRRIIRGQPDDTAGLAGAALAAMMERTSPLQEYDGRVQGAGDASDARGGPWSVQASSTTRYRVVESENIFSMANSQIISDPSMSQAAGEPKLVFVDERVAGIYGERIGDYFNHYKIDSRIVLMSISEQNKDLALVQQCIQQMKESRLPRRALSVVGIGGGALLDVVGTAASLYRRGVPYIRIPTTLLALVDAGVGAKVGVNFSGHKNGVGAYYPPLVTFLDKTFLATLDARQIHSGLAEILKVSIVRDRRLFDLLEDHGIALAGDKFQSGPYSRLVIRMAVQDMLNELAGNLWEQNLERRVDFGHSFSPGIELKVVPDLLHGEAVAIDMAISTVIARQRGILKPEEAMRILDLMRALELPVIHQCCQPEFLYTVLQETAVHRGGLQHLPLPDSVGSVSFFNDISLADISAAVQFLSE